MKIRTVIMSIAMIFFIQLVINRSLDTVPELTYDAFHIGMEDVFNATSYTFHIEGDTYTLDVPSLNTLAYKSGTYQVDVTIERLHLKTLHQSFNVILYHEPYYQTVLELYHNGNFVYFEPIDGIDTYDIFISSTDSATSSAVITTSETSIDMTPYQDGPYHIAIKANYPAGGRYGKSILWDQGIIDIQSEISIDSLQEGSYEETYLGLRDVIVIGHDIVLDVTENTFNIAYETLQNIDKDSIYLKLSIGDDLVYRQLYIKNPIYSYIKSDQDFTYQSKDMDIYFHISDDFNIVIEGLMINQDYEVEGNVLRIFKETIETHKKQNTPYILTYVIKEYQIIKIGTLFIE